MRLLKHRVYVQNNTVKSSAKVSATCPELDAVTLNVIVRICCLLFDELYASDKKRRTNKSPAALPDLESKIRKSELNDAVTAICLAEKLNTYRQIWQLRGGTNLLA